MKSLILNYRDKHGLTQKQAAERLGVSQSLIARMESEERFAVSPKMAIQLDRRSNGELRREELRPDIFGEVAA